MAMTGGIIAGTMSAGAMTGGTITVTTIADATASGHSWHAFRHQHDDR
jgi:hypothetical protein